MSNKVMKLNYKKLIAFILIVLVIVLSIIFGVKKIINDAKYKETYNFKLGEVGYSEEDTNTLIDKLSNKQLDVILSKKYDSNIIKFINQKYFLFNNLDKYIEYRKENKTESYDNIVSIINTDANIDWIDESRETDISKGDLMLVNRLYGLDSEFKPEDIIKISSSYAYSGVYISESILPDIEALLDCAKEAGYSLIVSDGYRSYKEQEKMYNSYVDSYGQSDADEIVARPGHSEYQTGISLDLGIYGKTDVEDEETEEYKWLKENASDFGFIFRFPSGKENITGFDHSTWRLRYVGAYAAKIMKNENITLEEYYAYYVMGEDK